MRHFARKQSIYQIFKDFGLGIAVFLTIFLMAAFDSQSAWPALMTTPETIFDRTDDSLVDKIGPQHNIATFIHDSLKPEYAFPSETATDQMIGPEMEIASAPQIFLSDALHLTFIAFLFASMFTLTARLWRYVRRENASPRRTRWRRD